MFTVYSAEAAEAERKAVSQSDWLKAAEKWKLTAESSRNAHNRDWCLCRVAWCRRMAGIL